MKYFVWFIFLSINAMYHSEEQFMLTEKIRSCVDYQHQLERMAYLREDSYGMPFTVFDINIALKFGLSMEDPVFGSILNSYLAMPEPFAKRPIDQDVINKLVMVCDLSATNFEGKTIFEQLSDHKTCVMLLKALTNKLDAIQY